MYKSSSENIIYNNFNTIYYQQNLDYIKNCHNTSYKFLALIYPKQFDKEDEDKEPTNIKVAGGNKIRATGNELFCIYFKKDTTEFTEPFNVTLYGKSSEIFSKQFKEPKKIMGQMSKAMKQVSRNNDSRYDYSELQDCTDMEKIRAAAKYSNTPYIVFSEVYDEELGLIKNPKID